MKETLLNLASAVVRQALQQYGMADRQRNIQPCAMHTNASANTTSSNSNNAGMQICGEISWQMVQYCLYSDGTYLRAQKGEEGAKRTVVVMLQVSMCVNEIKWFERTQQPKRVYY